MALSPNVLLSLYCLKLPGGALFPFYSGLSPVKINHMYVQPQNISCYNGLHAHFKSVASSWHRVGVPFTTYCFVLVRKRPFRLLLPAYIAILKRPICATIPSALYASGKSLSAIYSSRLVLVSFYLLPPRAILTGRRRTVLYFGCHTVHCVQCSVHCTV